MACLLSTPPLYKTLLAHFGQERIKVHNIFQAARGLVTGKKYSLALSLISAMI
jgi:hypothetical protein